LLKSRWRAESVVAWLVRYQRQLDEAIRHAESLRRVIE
jgi:hypothetical protein